jgi:membrane-bound metal-dependent hydrolase YbcI (DUF457 family)
MFIGHNGWGFASKRAAPRVSLGWLIAAPMFLDLIWPIFVLAGIEHVTITTNPPTPFLTLRFDSYPWSHSLLMSCIWGALFGAFYFMRTRDGRGGRVLAIGVVSHWLLDFFTHRPDMPLWPGGPKVGLELWYSMPATIIVEFLVYIAGVAVYLRTTRARDRVGVIGAWSLILFLAIAYIASIVGGAPPSVTAMASGALIMWLIPFWAAWFDRHRDAVA